MSPFLLVNLVSSKNIVKMEYHYNHIHLASIG
jgi:hypothetical protein